MLSLEIGFVQTPTQVHAQEPLKSYKVIGFPTYEKVLDIVFRSNERYQGYKFILRFEPNRGPESQLFIKRTLKGTQVIEYSPVKGTIYDKLNEILRNGGKENPVELAKHIQIQKRTIDLPGTKTDLWWTTFPATVGTTIQLMQKRTDEIVHGTARIAIDGTHYGLWYDQVESSFSFKAWDEDVSDHEVTGEFEVVRWMNTVRLDVEKSN